MIKLGELAEQKLKWVQPHTFKREYELHAGDVIAATLRYPRFFDTFAIAESADGAWTFKEGVFWQSTVTICTSEAETDVAIFKKNIWRPRGGMLELRDGRKYRGDLIGYKPNTGYKFQTERGELLVSYRWSFGILRVSASVQIHPQAKDLVELPWIVILGWYLLLLV